MIHYPVAFAVIFTANATRQWIKKTLHDALGAPEPDRAWSRKLGAAAMELLWALAVDAPAVVIEANFRPYSEYELDRIRGLAAHPVEVHCACPPELAVERYNTRATYAVHVVTTLTLDALGAYDRPVGLGTLISVDTTTFVDIPAIAATVRHSLGRGDLSK